MFSLLEFGAIIVPLLIGILVFIVVGALWYLYYTRKSKNNKPDLNLFNVDDSVVVSPTYKKSTEKKKRKRLEKENRIILKHYEKQLKNEEITVEEYKELVALLKQTEEEELNPFSIGTKQKTVVEEVEEEQDNSDEIDKLFIESENILENTLLNYYLNTKELYSLTDFTENNPIFIELIEEKIQLLEEIEYIANHNIEHIGVAIDGLLENRYELKNLISLELRDINELLSGIWRETSSLYYLESYVLTYNEEYLTKEQRQEELLSSQNNL